MAGNQCRKIANSSTSSQVGDHEVHKSHNNAEGKQSLTFANLATLDAQIAASTQGLSVMQRCYTYVEDTAVRDRGNQEREAHVARVALATENERLVQRASRKDKWSVRL